MSLVADYASSSGSDSENEAELSVCHQERGPRTQSNLTSQGNSSSPESDSVSFHTDTSSNKTHERKGTSTSEGEDKLPLPLPQGFTPLGQTDGPSSGNNLLGLSVFANPFEDARQEELSILEKHVKMKEHEKKDSAAGKGNKRICYKFQKGKCRFGDTCKFSHGGDNKPTVPTRGNNEPYPSAASGGHMGAPLQGGYYQDNIYEGERAEEDEEAIRKRRKDRAGLSEHLIPSKKAMRIYDRQRVQDRPWTAKR